MRNGGQTTVIKRLLERRIHETVTDQDTTATVAVMLRVLPPPRALLAVSADMRSIFEQGIGEETLEIAAVDADREALEELERDFRAIVVTDSLELIRRIRSRKLPRHPHILYITALDEPAEREAGLMAGANDCLGRRAGNRELHARIGTARRIAELEEVLRIALAENRKLSTTDDLTRVASRRFFSKHFPRETERAARYGRPLSLILCDIDYFKNVNDTLGHIGGDEVLKQFAGRLQEALRRGVDWVARIGGEEFAIVLPETAYEQALGVARRLRARIADREFEAQGCNLNVTASFGLCSVQRALIAECKTADRMLRVADAALYRSKNTGRNRVTATLLPERSSKTSPQAPPAQPPRASP